MRQDWPHEMTPGGLVPEPDGPAEVVVTESTTFATCEIFAAVSGQRWLRAQNGRYIVNPRRVNVTYHLVNDEPWRVTSATVLGPGLLEGHGMPAIDDLSVSFSWGARPGGVDDTHADPIPAWLADLIEENRPT